MGDDIRAGNFDENPKYTNSLYQTKPLRDQQNNQADLVDYMNQDNLHEMDGIELDDNVAGGEILQERKPNVPKIQYDDKSNLGNLKNDYPDKITLDRPSNTQVSPTANENSEASMLAKKAMGKK